MWEIPCHYPFKTTPHIFGWHNRYKKNLFVVWLCAGFQSFRIRLPSKRNSRILSRLKFEVFVTKMHVWDRNRDLSRISVVLKGHGSNLPFSTRSPNQNLRRKTEPFTFGADAIRYMLVYVRYMLVYLRECEQKPDIYRCIRSEHYFLAKTRCSQEYHKETVSDCLKVDCFFI